ncbi:branched-chain amino acid ABC transporter substrate-binding protein [Neorhizobium sp. SOG26]|uniref:ABC transporter substrate-binding protein n=1 Tax=Neorhizobium sp. SOG26 TaxID=2060726 RepID=UPI000E5859DB|nr:ABC transporter substrate-binding protein [Neorhizobium sp. SOG26]AXV15433.1 branched-chain amino acid ABC transporter substrate-binding protein [Neorhizobium sp. SOG26]
MTARRLIIAGLLAVIGTSQPAAAAVIGVVAPRSGPYALLGTQIFEGARAAAKAVGDTLVEVEESCEEKDGASVAKALADAKVAAAVGFLCVETLTTALPALKAAQIPSITVSVRSKILMEDALRNNWPFFRMAPAEGAEAEQLAETILRLWKAEPVAFMEDGTIYGRELVGAVRDRLEPKGMTAAFTDTFRPGQEQQIALVRRLAKAGITHALFGGDRNDAAIIARDAAAENVPLTLLGGDTLRGLNRPVPLPDGVLAIAIPDYASLPSAAPAVSALRAKGLEVEGYMLPAYAAVELAHQAVTAGQEPVAAFAGKSFSTAIGPIRFDENHELADNPFRLLEWRGSGFVLSPAATD